MANIERIYNHNHTNISENSRIRSNPKPSEHPLPPHSIEHGDHLEFSGGEPTSIHAYAEHSLPPGVFSRACDHYERDGKFADDDIHRFFEDETFPRRLAEKQLRETEQDPRLARLLSPYHEDEGYSSH